MSEHKLFNDPTKPKLVYTKQAPYPTKYIWYSGGRDGTYYNIEKNFHKYKVDSLAWQYAITMFKRIQNEKQI